MLKFPLLFGALALVAVSAAQAGLNASGSISFTQSAGVYTYDITLNNLGTTNVATLWYAWIPGQHYLPLAPTSTSGPAGWAIAVTHATGVGYGIRWNTTTNALAAGSSQGGFRFSTTATPAELLGDSVFYNSTKVGTSFVYETSAPPILANTGLQLVINPVPEPTALAALASGLAVSLRRRRR